MKSIVILVAVWFLTGFICAAERAEHAPAAAPGRMSVAIGTFENKSASDTSLFTTLLDRISDEIINTRKFSVVERERLSDVAREKELAEGGVTESAHVNVPTAFAGAGYVIYGTVLQLGYDTTVVHTGGLNAQKDTAKVEIQLRIANSENGTIIASKTIASSKSNVRTSSAHSSNTSNLEEQTLQDAVAAAAKDVVKELLSLAFPPKIIDVSLEGIVVNLAKEQTSIGAVYEVKGLGRELFDPDTGESLGKREYTVGEIIMTKTMPKMAEAEPVPPLTWRDLQPGMILRRVSEKEVNERQKAQVSKAKDRFEQKF